MVTIQHFVFVRSTSSLLLPSNDCVQNWNGPFCPPYPPYIAPNFFSPCLAPSFTPSRTVGYTHTDTGSHTHLHPNYILPFVYRQEPFVSWNTQPGLLLHTFLQLLSCIRTHTQHYKYSTWLVAGCQAGTIVWWTKTKRRLYKWYFL